MEDRELILRVMVVTEAYEAFGIVDENRMLAVVRLTAGIPWYVPPLRGEQPTDDLLFSRAVDRAAMNCTHGPFTPAHIMAAAVEIGGRIQSESGNMSDRRWVKKAIEAPSVTNEATYKSLPIPEAQGRLSDGS